MTFGEALHKLKAGFRIKRTGWTNTVLKLQVPDKLSKMTAQYIYLETVNLLRCPWTPDHSDILAEDWECPDSPVIPHPVPHPVI